MRLFDRLLRRGEFSDVVSVPLDHYVETFPSDRLLAVAGASTSLEAAGIVSTGMAAIVLVTSELVDEVVATDDIEPLVRNLLRAGEREERLKLRASWVTDENYWLTLGPAGLDELAEVTNEACLEILDHRYRQLLGDVVFAYRESEGAERSVFLIFDSRIGLWSPFVPVAGSDGADDPDRDFEFERQLQMKLADDLWILRATGGWVPFREAPF
jgi:hypothetical protein